MTRGLATRDRGIGARRSLLGHSRLTESAGDSETQSEGIEKSAEEMNDNRKVLEYGKLRGRRGEPRGYLGLPGG